VTSVRSDAGKSISSSRSGDLATCDPLSAAPIGTDDQCQYDRSSVKLQVALAAKTVKDALRCRSLEPAQAGFRRCDSSLREGPP
jgi:hypothetical protein